MKFKSLPWVSFVLLLATLFFVKVIENYTINKENEEQCKSLRSVHKKCSICRKNDLRKDRTQYLELYNGHINKEKILNHLVGKYSKYSCYSVDDLFDFHDGCSNDEPCPNSVLSIFPPLTNEDWCYFPIYAPIQNFDNQDERSKFPEDVIYLKGDRTSCSRNKKWVLSTQRSYFKYFLERKNWEIGKLQYSNGRPYLTLVEMCKATYV